MLKRLTLPLTSPPTFNSAIVLTDGSIFYVKTTTPTPVFVLKKDTLTSALWNPNSTRVDDSLGQIELFKRRFQGVDLAELSIGDSKMEPQKLGKKEKIAVEPKKTKK